MEYQRIEEINKRLNPMELTRENKKTGEITKSNYNTVNQRVLAFRELYPNGRIETEILEIDATAVLFKATAYDDDGKVIATGHAREEKEATFINKTSYVENCETSAVGRCLGMIGIGIVDALASYEEVANAINQQNATKERKSTADEKAMLEELQELYAKAGGADFNKWIKDCGGFKPDDFKKFKTKLLKQINDNEEAKYQAEKQKGEKA